MLTRDIDRVQVHIELGAAGREVVAKRFVRIARLHCFAQTRRTRVLSRCADYFAAEHRRAPRQAEARHSVGARRSCDNSADPSLLPQESTGEPRRAQIRAVRQRQASVSIRACFFPHRSRPLRREKWAIQDAYSYPVRSRS